MEVVAGAVAELHREAARLQQELLRRADRRSLPGDSAALLAELERAPDCRTVPP